MILDNDDDDDDNDDDDDDDNDGVKFEQAASEIIEQVQSSHEEGDSDSDSDEAPVKMNSNSDEMLTKLKNLATMFEFMYKAEEAFNVQIV